MISMEKENWFEYKPGQQVLLTPKNVCYYSDYFKSIVDEQGNKVANPLRRKAEKFLNADCIKYAGNNEFIVEPLSGYNKTTHFIKKTGKTGTMADFECSCQGFQSKLKSNQEPFCAHILTLAMCFKLNKFRRDKNENVQAL